MDLKILQEKLKNNYENLARQKGSGYSQGFQCKSIGYF